MRLVVLSPRRSEVTMDALGNGYFGCEVDGPRNGTRYGYRLDGGALLPDPASRSQPEGVAGPSALVGTERFPWSDRSWSGVPLASLVFYEIHVGTFSRAGTFGGVEDQLDRLVDLGITAVELMPVAQFPGRRNWGYDGVYPFAVQDSYGGLAGLQRLANACHARGVGLFLDVVYNHLGPEGNHLPRFGPYFTDRYRTPWGAALNFDGPGSDEVRRFFRESATWLVRTAHLDGLRVDAVHAIVDPTAQPFLAELTRAVHEVGARTGHPRVVIAESALNDPRVAWSEGRGGLGFDAFWNDDFHHALHVALTSERSGHYADFDGIGDLQRTLVRGFALDGRFSPYRGRRHGRPFGGLAADRLVVFAQNHDQVGNRPFGERLSSLVPFEAQKLAAGITLLSPFLPLLFMGSEYGERVPFLYFTDHRGRELGRAVRDGRRSELAEFAGGREPPDPQAPSTFDRSRLDPRHRRPLASRQLLELHRALLDLRRRYVEARRLAPEEVGADPDVIWVRRARRPGRAPTLALYRFSGAETPTTPPSVPERLSLRLASGARRWGGPGGRTVASLGPGRPRPVPLAPWSFAFYAGSESP